MSERTSNWNSKFQALTLYPSTPWEHILPTEAKFLGSRMGFRPICDGKLYFSFICTLFLLLGIYLYYVVYFLLKVILHKNANK